MGGLAEAVKALVSGRWVVDVPMGVSHADAVGARLFFASLRKYRFRLLVVSLSWLF